MKTFSYDDGVKDRLIQFGTGRCGTPVLTLRLIEIKFGHTVYADDPIKYFAAKQNQDLGVVKALRKPVPNVNLSPFFAPSQTFVQFS